MKRNFFITSHRLKVFEWQGSTLIDSFEFENDEQGHIGFEQYIHASDVVPTQILLELIEEDFLIVNVPFLRGKDRKSMIERMTKRHYRNAHFVYHQKIRILKGDRKEEELLFTAITNDESIDSWMGVIEKNKVPVSGIWSLPILCEELAKKLFPKKKNSLLISRQIRSAFRETYIRDGKLILSRIVRLSHEDVISETAESYMDHSVDKIKKFLTNKQYIKYNDNLDVICILPDNFIDEAKSHYIDSKEYTFRFYGLSEVQKKLSIKTHEVLHADAIFSYLCSTHPIRENPYGNKKDQANYFVYSLNRFIHNLSYMGSFALFLSAVSIGTINNNMSIETKELKKEKIALSNVYQEQYDLLQNQIDTAQKVQQHILFSNQLQLEANQSLENAFIPLSNILSKPSFERIKITNIAWEKLHGLSLIQILQDVDKEKSSNNGNGYYDQPNYDQYNLRYPMLTIKGRLNQNNLSYRQTVLIMDQLTEQFNNSDFIEKLWLIKAPVDIRNHANFSDQQGTDRNLVFKALGADSFEILLLLKGTPFFDPEVTIDESLVGVYE
ncbi:hypothetical protein [Marinicellulosiphila megalodicopiae]|uniref:hypothetical protein n=1 Tax=Marinicellulosiphila megalodicopiae TaxID=2724896 RepID=UPI003BB08AED